MFDLHTYRINGQRIAARTDAQARFAAEAIARAAKHSATVRPMRGPGIARHGRAMRSN